MGLVTINWSSVGENIQMMGAIREANSRGPDPTVDGVLFRYSIDRSSSFSAVVAEDSSQPFLSNDRP